MSTSSTLTIKGLIGKEFLYDENLFISNYNPFVTTNTSGISGLYSDTSLTGKLYIFNKKEYMEPTKEEFQNIKSISELADAHYRLINESTFNYLSVLILSKYNENSKERTFQLIKENSVVDINPILSNGLGINDFLYNPENNNLGTFAILVIDHSTETGKLNKKTYTDLAAGEQFLMYLIPSELINVSESGMDSTKLISLTLSDASKQSISTNSFEIIPSTIPEESGLNYFYAESLLTIPGDTKYTRTNTFNSINIYFKVTPNTNFNFETNGFGLSEILKQKIFDNIKASMLNDIKFSTFDTNVLKLDKLIFSLNNNEIFVSLTLSNTENNIILPETPTLNLKLKDELSYNEETVNEFLNVELLNFKGTYLLPLIYYTLRYNDSNGVDGFFELQQLAQNNKNGICFSTGDPDLDLPNRKVYLYGGAIDTSTSQTETITNTLLRSNIQNDGSLEGFTQIGTNSLNLFHAPTYTYINDPLNGTGWVYVFCGLRGAINAGTTTTTNRPIKRAQILSDGTIGTWEDIYTFDNFYQQQVIGNPDDKRYFYVYNSLKRTTGTYDHSFLNKIYTFRINEDGSIALIQTYTSTKSHYGNSSTILKDPVSNKQFLYIFGTRPAENDPSIYRYEIAPENQDQNLSYNILGNAIKVGVLDNIIQYTYLTEDRENVYIIGGGASTSNYKIGARRTVLKYSKDLLIKGSPTNLVNPEILPNISIPISVSVNQITTKYGSYAICPLTTTNETGTTYNWQSTNRVLGFKFNENNLELASSKLILNEFGNYPDDSVENKIDQRTNFFPNKFGARIKEELYTNLFVKQNQILEAYGETIKFINPSELTKPQNLLNGVNKITIEVSGATGILLRLFDKNNKRIIFNESDFEVNRSLAIEANYSNDGIKYHSTWALTNPKNAEMENLENTYLYGAYYFINNGKVTYNLNSSYDLSNLEYYELNYGGISTTSYKIYLNDNLIFEKTSGFKQGDFMPTFVNPSALTKPITIEEITKPVALPTHADIFLKWMEELSIETFFDKYNEYRYFVGKHDVEKDFSLVIPELIFNILYTKDLYELNKEIFKMYLISNPPSQETDPEMIINEDYIDTILYCFYRCRVGKDGSYISNKNALVFGANGLALPDISSIEYSSKIVDYGFIFFPQRHKGNEQAGKNKLSNLPTIPKLQNYFEKGNNLSGCSIDPKVPEEEIEKYLNAAYINEFDYFIAPDGNDSNSGRTIYTPKKTVESCTAGSKILLLPGEYSSAIGTLGSPNTYYSPAIINSGNRNVFGCGSLTKIKVLIPTEISRQRLRIFSGTNLSGSVSNMDIYINTNTEYTSSFGLVHWHAASHIFTFKLKNINFILNKPILRVASDDYNPGKTIFENCTFTHADVSSSFTGPKEYRTVTNSALDTILLTNPNSILINDPSLIANLKDNYAFKPMYTLIPLDKGQNESKTINLETTRNISKIPNLNYKLS